MAHARSVVYRRKADSGRGTVKQRERIIQRALTRWLNNEYPNVVFYNDWSSGAYLTAGQNKARLLLSCGSGWVDLFIAEPSRGYHGLFLEIKKEGVRPYLRDGKTLSANLQIRKEAKFLTLMTKKGYCGMFGSGLEECKEKIRRYLGAPPTPEATELPF